MPVLTRCPNCNSALKLSRRGIVGKCPRCQSRIQIPLETALDDEATQRFFAETADRPLWKKTATREHNDDPDPSEVQPKVELLAKAATGTTVAVTGNANLHDLATEQECSEEPEQHEQDILVDDFSDLDFNPRHDASNPVDIDADVGSSTDSLSIDETSSGFQLPTQTESASDSSVEAVANSEATVGSHPPIESAEEPKAKLHRKRRPETRAKDSARRKPEKHDRGQKRVPVVEPGFRRGSYASKISLRSILSLQFLSRSWLRIAVGVLLLYSIASTAGIVWLYFYK